MASCKHCGAPLAANTNKCTYCDTRNDVDLHAKFPYKIEPSASNRTCPECEIPLQTISLLADENLYIERCEQCLGLFFDRGEIEYVLQNSVSQVHEINLEHIDNINKDRYRKPADFQYLKCPECGVFMNRVNFGQRSGVVVDQCMMHGIWLENGELTHLQEWKKAGGQLLHHQTAQEKAASNKQPLKHPLPIPDSSYHKTRKWEATEDEMGLGIIGDVAWLLSKIFFGR
jgi:Zn-finger nucleic acid-binding protein